MKAILITRTDETSSVSTELREGEEAQHLLELITEAAKSCADDAKYVRGFVDDTDKGAVTAPGLTEHKADYLRYFRMWLYGTKETLALYVDMTKGGISVVVVK